MPTLSQPQQRPEHIHIYWLWYNSQDMEPAYMSANKWMDKENDIYICNEYYPVVKNKIMVFVEKHGELEIIMLTTVSQTTMVVLSLTCVRMDESKRS